MQVHLSHSLFKLFSFTFDYRESHYEEVYLVEMIFFLKDNYVGGM